MVPAEDLKVHIGSKKRVDIVYYHLAFNEKPTVDRRNSNKNSTLNRSKFQENIIRENCVRIVPTSDIF